MSFEQQEINRQYEHNREKEALKKSEAFWFEKKIHIESTKLLNNLAQEIAKEFGISVSEAKKLIESWTNTNLENLKSQIGIWNNIDAAKFHSAINTAKDKIASLSKHNREQLKELLESDAFTPETHPHILTASLFSKQMLERGKNPKNFSDQCIGTWLWLLDSSEAIILFLYGLGKWILLTPYHLYLLIRWKGKF